MAISVSKGTPKDRHTLTPHLVIRDANQAVAYYKRAFGAEEMSRFGGPDGQIMHAMLKIGDSMFTLSDEYPDMGSRSPKWYNGTTVSMYIYCDDVDAVFKRAIEAGGTSVMPVQDMFWGDRWGKLTDPFGHEWSIATHKEDIAPEEMAKRAQEAMKNMAAHK